VPTDSPLAIWRQAFRRDLAQAFLLEADNAVRDMARGDDPLAPRREAARLRGLRPARRWSEVGQTL